MSGGQTPPFSLTQSAQARLDIRYTISAVTHTSNFVYVATRSKRMFQYEVLHMTKNQRPDTKGEKPELKEPIVRLSQHTLQGGAATTLLLVQGESHLFFLPEKDFSSRPLTELPESRSVKFSAASPITNFFLSCDAQNLYIYESVPAPEFVRHRKTVPHQFKSVTDLVVAGGALLMYDKREFRLGEFRGDTPKLGGSEALPKPIKLCVPVDGANSFVVVFSDNQIGMIGEQLIEMIPKLTEEILAIGIRRPYLYVLTAKNLCIYAILAPITDTIQLPAKPKNPLLDVFDNYGVIYTSDTQVIPVRFNTPVPHMDQLQKKDLWEKAIQLCDAINIQGSTQDDQRRTLYQKYSEFLFKNGEFARAIDNHVKSGQDPALMIGHYKRFLPDDLKAAVKSDLEEHQALLESLASLIDQRGHTDQIILKLTEIEAQAGRPPKAFEAGRIIDQLDSVKSECALDVSETKRCLDNHVVFFNQQLQQNGNGGIVELRDYLLSLLKNERQSTKVKLYNTILIQCYASSMPMTLAPFIAGNPPLFFDVAAAALKSAGTSEAFLQLCELHHKHKVASDYLMQLPNYEQLIHYVRSSADCMKLAPEHCRKLYEGLKTTEKLDEQAAAERAVHVFFSPTLNIDDAKSFVDIIEKVDYVSGATKLKMLIIFLDFAIFERRLDQSSLDRKLIQTYLEALKGDIAFKSSRKYVAIAKEGPHLNALRSGLVRVLEESDRYDTQHILTEIPQCLWEERVAVYRRMGEYKACLDLVSNTEVDLSIALSFCDKVYVEEDPNRNSIYTELFFALNRQASSQAKIRELLNSRAERLDPIKIVENIPKEFKLQELTQFLSASSLSRINKLRSLRIRNALLEATIETKKVHRAFLQGGKVEVKDNLICVFCGRQIGESVFFVLDDNCVAHTACNPTRK
jgi:hypothetical protein